MMYCWHSVPGYSKIGYYTGNGSTDGSYIHCGFQPRWIWIKQQNGAGWSIVYDTYINPSNPANNVMYFNDTMPVNTGDSVRIDITSTGFKCRETLNATNGSGGTYLFMAFAEYPSMGANVNPAPAR